MLFVHLCVVTLHKLLRTCVHRVQHVLNTYYNTLGTHPKGGHSASSIHLIYKAEIVCQSVCVFAITARVSCSAALKLAVAAGGTGSQVIAGLSSPVLRFTESYPSISAFSFARRRFSNYCSHRLSVSRFIPSPLFCIPPGKIN